MSANREWSDLAERTEAAAMRRIVDDQSPEVQERLAMSSHRAGDGVHVVVVRDPMWGYWNKALGFCEPVTEGLVAEVVGRGREQGVGALALQLQPRVTPDDWPGIVERQALTEGTMFVKCFGPAEPRAAETDLRLTRLGPEHAADFVRIMAAGFGFEPTDDADAMFDGAQFFDGDWATYGAWDDDTLVAVARMLAVAETEAVALFGAATLPEGRNRGAQGALLDARIREARDRGLRWASAETWLESADNPNPSQHNLRRAGLSEVHTRPSWVWRLPG
ncbi:MAG: GNAT family N-acetyltransferase [Nocardioides sp.]